MTSIPDDPKIFPEIPFNEGTISFAGSGPDSRSSQLFIAYGGSKSLGVSPWETPIGEVTDGMENIRSLNSEYGDMPPWGKGPLQNKIRNRGRSYIDEEFPKLDYFKNCEARVLSYSGKDVHTKTPEKKGLRGDVMTRNDNSGDHSIQNNFHATKDNVIDSLEDLNSPISPDSEIILMGLNQYSSYTSQIVPFLVLFLAGIFLCVLKSNRAGKEKKGQ